MLSAQAQCSGSVLRLSAQCSELSAQAKCSVLSAQCVLQARAYKGDDSPGSIFIQVQGHAPGHRADVVWLDDVSVGVNETIATAVVA